MSRACSDWGYRLAVWLRLVRSPSREHLRVLADADAPGAMAEAMRYSQGHPGSTDTEGGDDPG